ncbi:MAG TPA: nucleotidyltransferase family protein [Tepidisphaeraceae bacterium]|nr:nucleotidyltransferase family protein [Tepidisphaeraceae bacterium]
MICAIVLAAGRSTRMGAQKLLLPFGRSTILGEVVHALSVPEVSRTFVVTGPDGAVARALAGRNVSVVTNPNAESEMLDSVRRGLQALPPDCEAVLVTPGDLPRLTQEMVRTLISAYRGSGKGIVVLEVAGRRGHPLLFSTRYVAEVLAQYHDVGLRGLPRAHADDVLEVTVTDRSVLSDVDTPEDYERERQSEI